MRCIMSQPFNGPCRSTRKISRSSMPCNMSRFFFFMGVLSFFDRGEGKG
jgi:hypothetical protein